MVDDALSPDFPLGDSLEVFVRRADAERFIEEVVAPIPRLAAKLRIEEREPRGGWAELAPTAAWATRQASFRDAGHASISAARFRRRS